MVLTHFFSVKENFNVTYNQIISTYVDTYLDSFTLRVNSIYISIEVSLVSTRQKLNQTVLAYLNTIGVQIRTSTLQKH